MPTQIFRSPEDTVLVIHEPGNMTRYVGTAHKIKDGPVGFKDHWVVSFPMNGGSMLVTEGQHLHWSYIYEKLGYRMTGSRQARACISEMTRVIGMMVPQVTVVLCTDPTGHIIDNHEAA